MRRALANMVLTSEHHADWIADTIAHLDGDGRRAIEPDEKAQDDWMDECARLADATLFPKADSWYVGANIPGKPRVFMLYPGGFGNYRKVTQELTEAGYEGFALR